MSLVLADTSVWVAHFRRTDPMLQSLLATDQVSCHPLVVIELACGTPPTPRERTIGDLKKLQQAVVATTDETLALIEREQLHSAVLRASPPPQGARPVRHRPPVAHP